jgi:hypothetical protein
MNYWEALPTPVPGRFYVPVTLQEWISPRGNASLGDEPPPCWGLCSRGMMQRGANQKPDRRDVAMDRHPAISEHGLVGGLRTAALNSKAHR